MSTKPKIVIVLGQTATGKSDLAVILAKKYNGEVISADSRQVYKGLNIGTGKITKKEMSGVPHYMLDIRSPKKKYSVSEWQKETKEIISKILKNGKLPIICGGTGFYIQSIVENIVLPEVPPNQELRKKLEGKTKKDLLAILSKLDPEITKTIDTNNPARLIRAIEIATKLGEVPKLNKLQNEYDILQIGLGLSDDVLKDRIEKRLVSRIKKGMIMEAKKLHKSGLSWKRMFELGLEYRYLSMFLQNKISKPDFIEKLNTEIWHYAKRQKTWFKRDKNINWFKPSDIKKIEKEVLAFIGKK